MVTVAVRAPRCGRRGAIDDGEGASLKIGLRLGEAQRHLVGITARWRAQDGAALVAHAESRFRALVVG